MARWSDIVALADGGHTIGVKSDGTVVEVFGSKAVADWKNILVPEK